MVASNTHKPTPSNIMIQTQLCWEVRKKPVNISNTIKINVDPIKVFVTKQLYKVMGWCEEIDILAANIVAYRRIIDCR